MLETRTDLPRFESAIEDALTVLLNIMPWHIQHEISRQEKVRNLFALVRIHVPLKVYDPETKVTRHIIDYVWDNVVENHKKWHTKDVRLLYMTHRHLQEDTSLIVDAKNADGLADFLMKHIATIEGVRGIWVINMAKMRFFRTQQEHPRDLSRFTVTIDAMPKHMDTIFESISSLKPGKDIIINYITNTFQSFKDSIMVSVQARSRNHMDAFVNQYIRSLEGVVDAEVTHISKTMRLVSHEEWQKHVGPYLVAPGMGRTMDIDAYDDSLIAGC